MELKIKKLREGAHIPKRATAGSAGMDLYACIPEAVTLAPGQLRVIPTGIAIELPDASCAAFLRRRHASMHAHRRYHPGKQAVKLSRISRKTGKKVFPLLTPENKRLRKLQLF